MCVRSVCYGNNDWLVLANLIPAPVQQHAKASTSEGPKSSPAPMPQSTDQPALQFWTRSKKWGGTSGSSRRRSIPCWSRVNIFRVSNTLPIEQPFRSPPRQEADHVGDMYHIRVRRICTSTALWRHEGTFDSSTLGDHKTGREHSSRCVFKLPFEHSRYPHPHPIHHDQTAELDMTLTVAFAARTTTASPITRTSHI